MEQLEKETRELMKSYSILYERMKDIADQYIRIRRGKELDDIESIVLEDEFIEVSGTEWSSCNCCSDEYYSYSIPVSYLWDVDWDEKLRKQMLEENLAAVKAKQERDAKAKKEQEERDYKKFLELKEKFNV